MKYLSAYSNQAHQARALATHSSLTWASKPDKGIYVACTKDWLKEAVNALQTDVDNAAELRKQIDRINKNGL